MESDAMQKLYMHRTQEFRWDISLILQQPGVS